MRIQSLEPGVARGENAHSTAPVTLSKEFRTLFAELQKRLPAQTSSSSANSVGAAGAASQAARSEATAADAEALATAQAVTGQSNAATVTTAGAASATTAPAATVPAAASNTGGTLTAEDVFGDNPWMDTPTGMCSNGVTFAYNPLYFATASTAQKVADMVGGKVVETCEFAQDSPFAQSQPNEMVELPNGALINPGLIAAFYTHGYSTSYVEQAIASEVAGAKASVDSGAVAPADLSVFNKTTASEASTTADAGAPTAGSSSGAPTAEQVFGANPWLTNPTGTAPNGYTFGYNPLYFATASTAQKVAQMVGGKVVEDNEFTKDTPGDPFAQSQPNEMVELPSGALINPGLIAAFYTHGYSASYVEQAIASEVAGAEASVQATKT